MLVSQSTNPTKEKRRTSECNGRAESSWFGRCNAICRPPLIPPFADRSIHSSFAA